MPDVEDCAKCPEQYPIYIHYNDCNANSTASGDWWFHRNDTSVHINFSNHYLLGTFFLFLFACLLTCCCLLVIIIVKTRKRGLILEAANNLQLFIKERKGETVAPTSVEVHAPQASVDSVFTMDTRSQGEYVSTASTEDIRSQRSMEVIV